MINKSTVGTTWCLECNPLPWKSQFKCLWWSNCCRYSRSDARETRSRSVALAFYIEGAMTVAVALVAMFVLPNFPTGSPRRRGARQSSGWKRIQESLMRSGMATTSRNGPCSLFDDRKTMMDLFGGVPDGTYRLENVVAV